MADRHQLAMQRLGMQPLDVIADEIGRMRRALDLLYTDDACRTAVIKHYGLRHVDLSECFAAARKQIALGVAVAAKTGDEKGNEGGSDAD